ncbi:hypothetical protein OFR22_03850 [Brachyspira hyodysenteriae]|uniref:Lipocalin-like domain-containing protein n=2 Tax=Brachyspira hyodysenteriae TaxID=159 RepID=A0A3B6VFL5_BRAHW|nr:hypothetical protein [Brachyspira hyodysenteriae]ACN84451.1 hypothetical protein BHWA1_01991 [Brachyspira hyodysenteriae WA1]ANN63464.1 hypothetical protein BHYOB78_06175 [Brachyspira hyodysenteriae ATCC 27164]AUJ50184.1 hypothetical protein BH718_01749 [Brachyspira hyodysenteriae]KLI16260.1 hypothetical protein SU44_06705 [Brachyspira hyodysenteriae]KLI17818.1 hypothetical protein SU46_08530 [Brachyspira hyodysenteriae]
MIKKIALLHLFLLLLISCNANSDGTTSASSAAAEPPRESKGLTNFIGIWQAKFPNNDCNITIESTGNVLYNDFLASSIEDLGNDRYKMSVSSDKTFSVTLKFKSDTEGTVEDDNLGIGTLTKSK